MNKTDPQKYLLFVTAMLLLASCASHDHSEELLSSLVRNACPINQTKCVISANELDGNGIRTKLNGTYHLKNMDDGSYVLSGSVKLRHDPQTWQNLDSLDINFMFFEGGSLVHEEKINLAGSVDEFLEFSKSVVIDDDVESTNWSGYTWKPSE